MGWFSRWLLFRLRFMLFLGAIGSAYAGDWLVAALCGTVLAALVWPWKKRAKRPTDSGSGEEQPWAGN